MCCNMGQKHQTAGNRYSRLWNLYSCLQQPWEEFNWSYMSTNDCFHGFVDTPFKSNHCDPFHIRRYDLDKNLCVHYCSWLSVPPILHHLLLSGAILSYKWIYRCRLQAFFHSSSSYYTFQNLLLLINRLFCIFFFMHFNFVFLKRETESTQVLQSWHLTLWYLCALCLCCEMEERVGAVAVLGTQTERRRSIDIQSVSLSFSSWCFLWL